jgi:hypothetical protein
VEVLFYCPERVEALFDCPERLLWSLWDLSSFILIWILFDFK